MRREGSDDDNNVFFGYMMGIGIVFQDPVYIAHKVRASFGEGFVDLEIGVIDYEQGLLTAWLEREGVLSADGFPEI